MLIRRLLAAHAADRAAGTNRLQQIRELPVALLQPYRCRRWRPQQGHGSGQRYEAYGSATIGLRPEVGHNLHALLVIFLQVD